MTQRCKSSRTATFLALCCLVVLPVLNLLNATHVFGLSDEQKRIFDSGILYFDVSPANNCSSSSSATSSSRLAEGSKVYILGDSITESAKAKYVEVLGQNGITATVNASANRKIDGPGNDGDTGLEAIEKDKAIISDPSTKAIVVALGTNGGSSATNISSVVSKLRALSSAKIYWVDTIVINKDDILERIKNANVAIDNESRNNTITPISWFKAVDPSGDPLNPTGNEKDLNGYIVDADVHVHPTAVGVNALVDLVSSAVINNASPNSQLVVASGCSCSVEVATSLNGNDNFEKTWNFFAGKGLPANAIAGMMGNLMAESGINPQNMQNSAPFQDGPEMPTEVDKLTGQIVPNKSIAGSYGYGLMQWTTASRQQGLIETARRLNKPTGDLEAQLEHVWFELGTSYFDDVLAKLQEPGVSLNDASDKVALDYATPRSVIYSSEYSPDVNEARRQSTFNFRRSLSQDILAKYSGIGNISSLSSSTVGCANITGQGEDTKYVDGFTIYNQNDRAWKDKPYGTSTIGLSGCGPSAMAMIITNLTGTAVSPAETTAYANEQNMYIENVGSSWSVAPKLAEHWGLKATPFSNGQVNDLKYIQKNVGVITALLRAGVLIIGAGGGAKPFTDEGHYIVIRGVTASGKFKVADSWHKDTAEQEWDPEQILSQMSTGSMYAITK